MQNHAVSYIISLSEASKKMKKSVLFLLFVLLVSALNAQLNAPAKKTLKTSEKMPPKNYK